MPKRPAAALADDARKPGAFSRRGAPLYVHLFLLIASDLLARTGYQMAKSPVLPLFARHLGAGTSVSGAIVAVSTVTGLIASPLIGTLSDLYGRRRLLIAGAAIFASMPGLYLLIRTPGQLLAARLAHGFATAIYGPVVTAAIADLVRRRRARVVGWYRSARTASYMLGPLLGGFVLLYGDFRLAWLSVGALGLAAFVPILLLPKTGEPAVTIRQRSARWRYLWRHLLQAFRDPTLLALGSVQAALYLGLRANRAFLPLYGDSVGFDSAQIGLALSIQVTATLLTQPLGGVLAERMGHKPVILTGLLLVAAALPLLVVARAFYALALLSILMGLGEAIVMPSVITLGTELSDQDSYGSTLGMLDAMDNVGKALGPVVAGLLLGVTSYVASFALIAGLLAAAAALFGIAVRDLRTADHHGQTAAGEG